MKKLTLFVLMIALAISLTAEFTRLGDADDSQPQVYYKVINTRTEQDEAETGYFGFSIANLSRTDAKRISYPWEYGILIPSVVEGGPAANAGFEKNDILISLDGERIQNTYDFDRVVQGMYAGDIVEYQIWRDGVVMEGDIMLGKRPSETVELDLASLLKTKMGASPSGKTKATRKRSGGYGGLGWTTTRLHVDMTDINTIMANVGLEEYRDTGVLTHGYTGKGHVGRGYFIGFQYNGFGDSHTIRDLSDPADPYDLRIKNDLSLMGVTLDKRYAITRHLVTSIGMMVGGASHEIKLSRTKNEYEWPNTIADIPQGNFNADYYRDYLMIQPRAEILVSFLPWLGLRLEGGYVYTYSAHKGWRVKDDLGYSVNINNSPNTTLEGFSIGIGPWFGF